MNQNLAKLATDYATAALNLCSDHYSEDGRRFRFTANRHIVEILYEDELGWSLIADGVTVKQGDADDDLHPTEEGWLALVRLIHPTETNDREARELFREICREKISRKSLEVTTGWLN